MQNNKKSLVFGYPLFYKVAFIILVLIVGWILYVLLKNALIRGISWNTIVVCITFVLFLDFSAYIMFSKITITSSGLSYKPGGLILRWLFKSKKFNWQDYSFYIYYWDYRILDYLDIYLLVTDKRGKVCFRLEKAYHGFKELIEEVRIFCPKYESIGVKGLLKYISIGFRLKI